MTTVYPILRVTSLCTSILGKCIGDCLEPEENYQDPIKDCKLALNNIFNCNLPSQKYHEASFFVPISTLNLNNELIITFKSLIDTQSFLKLIEFYNKLQKNIFITNNVYFSNSLSKILQNIQPFDNKNFNYNLLIDYSVNNGIKTINNRLFNDFNNQNIINYIDYNISFENENIININTSSALLKEIFYINLDNNLLKILNTIYNTKKYNLNDISCLTGIKMPDINKRYLLLKRMFNVSTKTDLIFLLLIKNRHLPLLECCPEALSGTEEERQSYMRILNLFFQGKTKPQIINQLGLPGRRYRRYVSNMLEMLGVNDMIAAVLAVLDESRLVRSFDLEYLFQQSLKAWPQMAVDHGSLPEGDGLPCVERAGGGLPR